jgi:hypothetical protein
VTPASMASRDVPGLKQGEQRRRACLGPTAQHRPSGSGVDEISSARDMSSSFTHAEM